MDLYYIKIRQKNEYFLLTKMNALELKNCVNFYFRNPYSEQSEKDNLDVKGYIKKLSNEGISIKADPTGIQRRINLSKINDIKETIVKESECMANAVLLAIDFDNEDIFCDFWDKRYEDIFNDDKQIGILSLPEGIKFQIVDGQHRLAGILTSDMKLDDFDVPIILLLDSTKNMIAKIFSDINGYQTKVKNSVILDLLEEVKPTEEEKIIDKSLHNACKSLNNDFSSPFYHSIKMLGYGFGAISQSFFVSSMRKFIQKKKIVFTDDTYNNLFVYFQVIQDIFSEYWPIPVKDEEMNEKEFNSFVVNYFKEKSDKYPKNQIMKTNGIGALMYLYTDLYKESNDSDELYDYYYSKIELIKDFDWCNDELISTGAGEKTQKLLYKYFTEKIDRKN